jgi:hypothetical protein
MRRKPIVAFGLAFFTMAWIGAGSAGAQESSPLPPLPGTVNLEYSGAAPAATASPAAVTSASGKGQPAAPTPQGLDARKKPSNAALSQLVNPFDGGRMHGRRGTRVPASEEGAPAPMTSAQSAALPLSNPFDGGTRPVPSGTRVPATARNASAPMASEQGSGPAPSGGKRGLGQARNPFDAGYGQPQRGLLEQASPQAAPAPQAPTGGVPGATGAAEGGPTAGGAPAPGAEGAPGAATPPSATTPNAAAPITADTLGEAGTGTGAGFGGTPEAGPTPFAMIGDAAPFSTIPGPPRPPGARGASPIFPSVRNFKISENQSPRPQDRVFFDFNYYNNLNNTINLRDLSPITQMKAYVYNFGIEKTFNNGMGSVGIRVPLDNLTANSFGDIVNTPTSTATGNLTIFAKYILAQNVKTGSLVSTCWAISPQTGPGRFAGAPYLFPLNSTYFQTCIAYIYNYEKWYLQGFSGFSFPANSNDTTLIYNDIALGYYLYRNQDSNQWLTAVAPTFELHVNNPLTHRDPFNRNDLAGSPDTVDLTFGLNFGIRNTAVLTAAFVTPVASPKPFDSEAVLMLNIFYGRSRRTVPITPPPL